ncbi:MAG: hypothetical protein C0511_16020 [Hyphomicrobium sp.]|nr:hypothetical protein [Hyphomicrobium sp.]PPC80087.1 MAG: hypothetical protein CTY40_09920 [Hyphomicrobium sp.]
MLILFFGVSGCATRPEPVDQPMSLKDTPHVSAPQSSPAPKRPVAMAQPTPKVVKAVVTQSKTVVAAPAPAKPSPAASAVPKTIVEKKAAAIGECQTASACGELVQFLVDTPDRSWISAPATPAQYATGVRLFAYERLRPSLTCKELVIAADEIAAMIVTFQKPVEGVAPETTTRTRDLGTRIESELKIELKARC